MNRNINDIIVEDIDSILVSIGEDGIYNSGDIIKRVIRDNKYTKIYVLDVSCGGIVIIKSLYGYSLITLSEDDGYFYPSNISISDKVSFVYIMSEAISMLNNINS